MKNKTFRLTLAAVAFTICAPTLAANYPEKPVQVILPWPPLATSTDVIARKVLEAMGEDMKAVFKVVNKPGGAGVVGTNDLVGARPDGYTIAGLTIGPAVSQIAAGNTPYKMDDLEPIGLFTTLPFLVLAKADAKYANIKELAAYAKTAEKPVVLAHWGKATVPTLSTYRMAAAAGFKFNEVTFSKVDTSQLLNGDAQLAIVPLTAVLGSIKSGETKPIVALTPERMAELPDLATVREQGFDFDVSIWTGLFAPKGTPASVIEALSASMKKAITRPDVKKFIDESGALAYYKDAKATKAQMNDEFTAFKTELGTLGLLKK